MDGTHLSKRLLQVADFVQLGTKIADIGSDHGYLPVFLAHQQKISGAIAVEVVKGPYENTLTEVENEGFSNLISVRLADGLAGIEVSDQIQSVVIAGMGGSLIKDILTTGIKKLSGVTQLILQPNVGEYGLRKWLMVHQYEITHEAIIEEDSHIYEIIVSQPINRQITYSNLELRFGPILIQDKSAVFLKKWRDQLIKHQHVIDQLEKSKTDQTKKIAEQTKIINEIKEVL